MQPPGNRTPPPGKGGGADCEAGATQLLFYREDEWTTIPPDPIGDFRAALDQRVTLEVRARAYEALGGPRAYALADAARLRARIGIDRAVEAMLPTVAALGDQIRRSDPWLLELLGAR
jgi:hypothetical protein